ncbi:hypothetical protein V1277_006470 [Bradyrhizobium sp. AZCC 1588]
MPCECVSADGLEEPDINQPSPSSSVNSPLLPKVRDIKSQRLSYVIRGQSLPRGFPFAITPSSREMFSSRRWLVRTRK